MSKCKCITAKGERCSRTAVTAEGYCNQHNGKCKRTVTQQPLAVLQHNLAAVIPKSKKRVTFKLPQQEQGRVTRRQLGQENKQRKDWKTVVEIGTKNGYDVYIIPKGTILYRGTSISVPHGNMKGGALFLGDFPLAAHYAYENNDVLRPSNGKIVEYETLQDIEVLNMNSITTLMELSKKYNTTRTKDILQKTFGFKSGKGKINRYSDYETDGQLAEWYCSTTGAAGYAIIDPPGFHSEVMLCDQSLVRETGVEHRWIPFFDTKHIYETSDGQMTGKKTIVEGLAYKFNGRPHIMKRFSFPSNELPYIGKYDPYVKPRDTKREAFMQTPEIKDALVRYLKKDRKYLEDDEPEIYELFGI